MKKIMLKLCAWILCKYNLVWDVRYTISFGHYTDASALKCKSYVLALTGEEASKKIAELYRIEGVDCVIDNTSRAFFSVNTGKIL